MFLLLTRNVLIPDDPPCVWRWRIVAMGLTAAVGLVPICVLKPLGITTALSWLGFCAFLAGLGGSLALIWGVVLFLERRVYRRLQAERVCIKCFYCLDHGNPENPLCPECGFSKSVSDVLRKQFRWGKWGGATFTRRQREPGKYAADGGISKHVRLPYGAKKKGKTDR